jgi:hypothetical protein
MWAPERATRRAGGSDWKRADARVEHWVVMKAALMDAQWAVWKDENWAFHTAAARDLRRADWREFLSEGSKAALRDARWVATKAV